VQVLADKPISPHPSSLSSLSEEELAGSSTRGPKHKAPRRKFWLTKPIPWPSNSQAYDKAKATAEANQDPTPSELTELFRVMQLDSPFGELRQEGYAIWKEMRARGVLPTEAGYVALLKVLGNWMSLT
jgi:hypothetical protein